MVIIISHELVLNVSPAACPLRHVVSRMVLAVTLLKSGELTIQAANCVKMPNENHIVQQRSFHTSVAVLLTDIPRVRAMPPFLVQRFGSPVLNLDYLLQDVVERQRPLNWELFWEKQATQVRVGRIYIGYHPCLSY